MSVESVSHTGHSISKSALQWQLHLFEIQEKHFLNLKQLQYLIALVLKHLNGACFSNTSSVFTLPVSCFTGRTVFWQMRWV